MRSTIRVQGATIKLRAEEAEHAGRVFVDVDGAASMDPHEAALLASEIERAAKAAQGLQPRVECDHCEGGDLCHQPACLLAPHDYRAELRALS